MRFAWALALVVLLAAGCRSPSSPTTSLKDVPTAGSPGATVWSQATSLEGLPEGPRKPFGPEPPELLFGETEEYPLPSRTMVPGQGVQKTIDRVVGRVNKDIITLSEVQELAQPIIARIPPNWPEERRKQEMLVVQNAILNKIIDHRLQAQYAKRLGVAVEARELDEAVADVMAKNNLAPEQFDALLAREGLSMEQYRGKIEEQIVRRRVYSFEIISRVQVSDSEVKDFYMDNIKQFVPPSAIALSQIFIALPPNGDEVARLAAHKKAELVLDTLKKGEPFAMVARAHSEDPTSGRGGLLGRFAPGEMIPDLEEAAFAMSEGEIQGPLPTGRGLHFIKVDKKWGDKPVPLEQIHEKVKQVLLNKRRNERYLEWMETLRGDAFIERVNLVSASAGRG